MKKKIVFLTGTRADYGKIKPLLQITQNSRKFEPHVFVTGMHMLSRYGGTWLEIEKDGFKRIYKYINQSTGAKMDTILSHTIFGFSAYINEIKPDMIVVHGDRLEALAGAIVGAFNNILVAHIEGGEISGTIDESIRHSISKLSHLHFVANSECKKRLIQMGERADSIFVIGSADIDIMLSKNLPSLRKAKRWYEVDFDKYGILIFHPVTTELHNLRKNISEIVSAVIDSGRNYIVIYPNNDEGSQIIFEEYQKIDGNNKIRLFPSVRFEYFLSLLKKAEFIIGNSSSGIREAMVYGVPSINIGTRQANRLKGKILKSKVINVDPDKKQIMAAISKIPKFKVNSTSYFGDGHSAENFLKVLSNDAVWDTPVQKVFMDLEDM